MNFFWSLSAKVLCVLLLVAVWFMYTQHTDYQTLVHEHQQLKNELSRTNELLVAANQQITALEKETLDGMLKETNKALLSGWDTLLDSVEGELTKARKILQSKRSTSEAKIDDDANEEKIISGGDSPDGSSLNNSSPNNSSPVEEDTSENNLLDDDETQSYIEGERT